MTKKKLIYGTTLAIAIVALFSAAVPATFGNTQSASQSSSSHSSSSASSVAISKASASVSQTQSSSVKVKVDVDGDENHKDGNHDGKGDSKHYSKKLPATGSGLTMVLVSLALASVLAVVGIKKFKFAK